MNNEKCCNRKYVYLALSFMIFILMVIILDNLHKEKMASLGFEQTIEEKSGEIIWVKSPIVE